MKKFIFLFVITATLITCKDNPKKEMSSEENKTEIVNTKTYRGEYIHAKEGAVLYGKDFIYGVVLNELEKELAAKVSPVKKNELDMVPIVVKGYVTKKNPGEEGWDERLTITEIVLVGSEPSTPDIKVESKKE